MLWAVSFDRDGVDRAAAMYKVTGHDPAGRRLVFACGTDEQALEKTWELAGRGFREISVIDPKGREMSALAFERSLDLDYDLSLRDTDDEAGKRFQAARFW